MSYDLAVLGMSGPVDAETAGQMLDRCSSARRHVEGELDERVVAFYEELRAHFPGYPPYGPESPWIIASATAAGRGPSPAETW
ncbi:hypothetical protein ACFPOI_09390 [Nonomuraea angiospora]|uniref:Uncharacterized protein n=1 Tax=Nonomuraea angiospora TaxID=46172 RepID=A0ABR9M9J4_9ACTN|nr:hypothetical protein [Nonomuraea angiospora]MBE1589580.1 hypothetical protein [Nonomuraea angiospora]